MHLISVMGVTNTGKSTLLAEAAKIERVGLIEVGKELRRRHPPEYFNGFAAMKHTEDEVWEIFGEQYDAAKSAGCSVVLADGQPRIIEQVGRIVGYDLGSGFSVLHLYASRETLTQRARERDAGNAEALALSLQRLQNDYGQLIPVLAALLEAKDHIIEALSLNTERREWIADALRFIEDQRTYHEGSL